MNPLKIIVTLSYAPTHVGDEPYRIESVKNDIGVQVTDTSRTRGARYHVGDYLTEAQASELLSEPGLEVNTIIRKV